MCFLDRALPDSLAYYRYLELEPEPELLAALEVASYRKVFALDLLPLAPDYARTESVPAQHRIHAILIEVYEELGYLVEKVPVLPVEQRLEFILSRIEVQPAPSPSPTTARP